MKMRALFGLSCLILFFSAAAVHGQSFGYGSGSGQGSGRVSGNRPAVASQPITISETRSLPHNSWVILTGNIVNALPRDRYYTFRDLSGEVTVEIDWNVWRGLSFNPSDEVEICGEVIINRGQVLIGVKAITSINGIHTGQGRAVTINEAINLPHHSWVVLTGNIVNALPGQGDRHYTFRDSSGEIIVEIDWRVWRGLSVSTSDRVEICGEVNTRRPLTSINVRVIRKI